MSAAASDNYLGRWQQGQEVPVWVLCKDISGVPTNPDAAPAVRVYSGAALILSGVALPTLEPTATTGLFAGKLYLDETFAAGAYTVLASWSTGGHSLSSQCSFEVVAGGDPTGQVLAMTYYHQPQADFYVNQRSSGRTYKGKNPGV